MEKLIIRLMQLAIAMVISNTIMAQESEPYDNKIILIKNISEYEIEYMSTIRSTRTNEGRFLGFKIVDFKTVPYFVFGGCTL